MLSFSSAATKQNAGPTDESLEYLPGWTVTSVGQKGLSDCSLIIPTYRRPAETVTLLQNLLQHDSADVPSQVVLVDGSPGDETELEASRWIANSQAPFDLVYVRSSPGLTRQKNVGVDISSGEYLYFLDDDTKPEPGYFRELRAVFVADKRKLIGAAGGAITNEMDLPLSVRWKIRLALRIAPRLEPMRYDASGMSLPRALVKPFSDTRRADIVPGGASCFRREVFRTYRFSEFFTGYSNGEDVEMSLRTGKTFQIAWCGSARLTHHPAPGGRPPGFMRGRMDVWNRLFIRNRFWPTGQLVAGIRFWADVGLVSILDFARFCYRPWDTSPIRHAAGMFVATGQALFSPPTFDDPAPCRQYALAEISRPV